MADKKVPSLLDWMGGSERVEELIARFYDKVVDEPLLQPLFGHMDAQHSKYVAMFISEVFDGPLAYTANRGGHAHMIRQHLGKGIAEEQRQKNGSGCSWKLPTTSDRQTIPSLGRPSWGTSSGDLVWQ